MAQKKFLLVCEGPSDIVVLEAMSKALTNANGHTIEISPLSPQLDATSGSYPPHGWTAVRAWCQGFREKKQADVANLPKPLQQIALRKNWKIIAAASGADGIIVQLDTDIAEQIVDLPARYAVSGQTRREYCESAICHWLQIPKVAPEMFLVLSTYSTESWLLACHDPGDPVFADIGAAFNYEDIADCEDRLLTLGYKRKSGRLDKKPSHYQGYSQVLVSKLNNVRQRCSEAEFFCQFIESA